MNTRQKKCSKRTSRAWCISVYPFTIIITRCTTHISCIQYVHTYTHISTYSNSLLRKSSGRTQSREIDRVDFAEGQIRGDKLMQRRLNVISVRVSLSLSLFVNEICPLLLPLLTPYFKSYLLNDAYLYIDECDSDFNIRELLRQLI